MASGPLEIDPVIALREERDALARRLAASEQKVRQLNADLDDARAQVAALEAAGPEPLSLFEGDMLGADGLTGDGSDPRVLSMVLGATAVVAGMVTLLTLLNGKLASPFGVAMVLGPEPGARTLGRLSASLVEADPTPMADPVLEQFRASIPTARALPLLEAIARGPAHGVVLDYLDATRLQVAWVPRPAATGTVGETGEAPAIPAP